jgi:lysophospholipase L1-like esterase
VIKKVLILLPLLLILLFGVSYKVINDQVQARPDNSPIACKKKREDGVKRIFILGDSLTHGTVSYNYLDELQQKLGPSYQLINGGLNGDLSVNALKRIDEALNCRPEILYILIGGNDVLAASSEEERLSYLSIGKITADQKPGFELFSNSYREILKRLEPLTDTKISLISLGFIGEELDTTLNQQIIKYSRFIKSLAIEKKVGYVAFNEKMTEVVASLPASKGTVNFDNLFWLIRLSTARYYILGQTWDQIALEHGFQMTPDFLHLGETSGHYLATLVLDSL